MLTVLDFQMRVEAVNPIISEFDRKYGKRSHKWLKAQLNRFPNTRAGNLALADMLWNNRHWTRAGFLRAIVSGLELRGITDQATLRKWLQQADFERDVQGQFRSTQHSMGIAIFHWLSLRCGVDTIKPDLHVMNFVENVIGRRLSPKDTVAVLISIARDMRRRAYLLDSAIWQHQKDRSSSSNQRSH